MNKDSKIFVAGHRGLVGSAILKNLKAKGYNELRPAYACGIGFDRSAGRS